MNDVIISKISIIQRCVKRAREEYSLAAGNFADDYTRQDAASANVTRACEAAIDIANALIRIKKLGVPNSSGESFAILQREGILSGELTEKMKRMVGFRNLAIHAYDKMEIQIFKEVITQHLDDLLAFTQIIAKSS